MHLSPGISLNSVFLCLASPQFSSRYLSLHVLDFPLVLVAFLFRDTVLSSLLVHIHSLMPASPTQTRLFSTPQPQPNSTGRHCDQSWLSLFPIKRWMPSISCRSLPPFLRSPRIRGTICRPVISWPTNQFLRWWSSQNQCLNFVWLPEWMFDSQNKKSFIKTI